ncbi:hypothetical protein B0H14DRAFT_3870278, partial [Mycena olivaceomarginata]
MQPRPQNPKVLAARAQLDFSTSTIKWLSSAHSLGSLRANQLWRLLAAFVPNLEATRVSWAKALEYVFTFFDILVRWFKAISSAAWGFFFFFQLGRNNKHRRSPPARHRTVNCSSVVCVLCHRSCRTSTSLRLIQFVSYFYFPVRCQIYQPSKLLSTPIQSAFPFIQRSALSSIYLSIRPDVMYVCNT